MIELPVSVVVAESIKEKVKLATSQFERVRAVMRSIISMNRESFGGGKQTVELSNSRSRNNLESFGCGIVS